MNKFELSGETVSKAELIDMVFERTDLPKKEVRRLVETFFESIVTMLEGGDSVRLKGFGVFDVVEKKARPGRNLSTGEPVTISARRVVNFRVSNLLRRRIQDRLDKRRVVMTRMQRQKKS